MLCVTNACVVVTRGVTVSAAATLFSGVVMRASAQLAAE